MLLKKYIRINWTSVGVSVITFCFAFSFLSCIKTQPKYEIVLTEEHNDKIVDLKGDINFSIRLKAQLSTGFSWKIIEHGNNVVMTGKPEIETQRKQIVGGIDYQIFVFKTTQKGLDKIVLHYLKPFEKEPKPEKSYTIKINVM